MADVSKAVSIIFEADDRASAVAAKVAAAVDSTGNAAKRAADQAVQSAIAEDKWADSSIKAAQEQSKLGDEVEKTSRAAKGSADSISEVTRVFQLLAGSVVLREFIDANVAVENFGRSMTLITGSTQGAADSLEYVRKISNTLGLELTGTANNFVALSAAAKGTALEGQGTRDIFEAISSAMALLGKSSSETNGALLAVQQIISKGTVSSEELRGQLGERLPGAFQIAARSIGVTTEELGNLLQVGAVTAEDFLPKFAAELNKTFGDTAYVTTFNAELNRLTNSAKELAITFGGLGVFNLFTEALNDLSRSLKTTGIEVQVIGGYFNAIKTFLAGGGTDVDGFSRSIRDVGINAGIASSEITRINESAAETARLLRQVGDSFNWSEQIDQSAAETKRLFGTLAEDAGKVAEAYKLLGISKDKVNADFVGGLETLVNSSEASAKDIQAALKFVIPKIENADELERFSAAAAKAAGDGDITWSKWAESVKGASDAFLKSTGYVKENTAEVKKQADEVKKAEENAAKLALELEKLASNERIKALEFRAEINVAQIEADTKRVEAAFDSVNEVVGSTNDLMGELFGILASPNLDWAQIRAIEDQINKENEIKKGQLQLQRELTEAQIRNLNAQTDQIAKGDALIKVDGAGLQPHLEAFMWEILRTIQLRANRDGRALLLGL